MSDRTSAAGRTLDAIAEGTGNGSYNTWENDDRIYFFEVGDNNPDGAITGEVYRVEVNGDATPCGDFRIESSGSVTRFPHITNVMLRLAQMTITQPDTGV